MGPRQVIQDELPILFIYLLYLVLGVECRGILLLSYTPSPFYLFFILKQSLIKLLRLATNLRSSCLSLPSTRITSVCHYAQL